MNKVRMIWIQTRQELLKLLVKEPEARILAEPYKPGLSYGVLVPTGEVIEKTR